MTNGDSLGVGVGAGSPDTSMQAGGVSSAGVASVSCERCKLRKSRCDRQQPSCERCKDAGVSCRYADRRRPGFPAGHRELLEAKIRRLEGEVQALRRSQSQSQTGPDGTSTDDQPPAATFERTRRITERPPPTDLVMSLVALFFRHIYPWFPLLDSQRVFADLGSMQDPSLLHHALFGISLPFSYDLRLDQASSDSFWKYSKRRIFVEALEEPSYSALEALAILTLDLSGMTNGPQVWGSLAVAVKLAVLLKAGEGRVFRTSARTDGERALSAREETCRQRLFWAVYALDCYVSLTTGHACDLADEHVQELLPLRQSAWTEPGGGVGLSLTPHCVFTYQLELMDIVRRAHAVYLGFRNTVDIDGTALSLRQFASCSAELTRWTAVLPDSLACRQPQDLRALPANVLPSVVMLHTFLHAITIHLNGLISYPPEQALASQASALRAESQHRCAQSVAALAGIASDPYLDKLADRLGWPFAWSVWVAARYSLVAELHRAEAAGPGYFDALLGSLDRTSRYWQIAGKYRRLLKQAAEELRSGGSSPEGRGQGHRLGVLGLLTDLRVPTSDLEDRFRTDPVLQDTLAPAEHVVGTSSEAAGGSSGGGPAGGDLLGPSMVYDDNWFSMPLFAASASQYYLTPGTSDAAGHTGLMNQFYQ